MSEALHRISLSKPLGMREGRHGLDVDPVHVLHMNGERGKAPVGVGLSGAATMSAQPHLPPPLPSFARTMRGRVTRRGVGASPSPWRQAEDARGEGMDAVVHLWEGCDDVTGVCEKQGKVCTRARNVIVVVVVPATLSGQSALSVSSSQATQLQLSHQSSNSLSTQSPS